MIKLRLKILPQNEDKKTNKKLKKSSQSLIQKHKRSLSLTNIHNNSSSTNSPSIVQKHYPTYERQKKRVSFQEKGFSIM